MPIARDGWPLILPLLGVGGGLLAFRLYWLGGILVLLALFVAFFFRDPERAVPTDPRLVLSPADGKVVQAVQVAEGPLGTGATRVSIFLSVFDVHVNRAPIAGRVAAVEYSKGAFLPAFDDRASQRNEQNTVIIEDGRTRVAFKQIAGIIARRIVFRKQVSDLVTQGERVGMIKFGSRVDVFLAPGMDLRVQVGDRVRGGTSVIAARP